MPNLATRTYSVLVVEERPQLSDLIRQALDRAAIDSFRLEQVTTLAEAQQRLVRLGVDVVLLDLTLPDSRGVATFKSVQQAAGDVPIVIVAGYDDAEVAHALLQQGAQDYLLVNEVEPPVVPRSLRYAIERHRSGMLEVTNRKLQDDKASLTNAVKNLERVNQELQQFTSFASHDLQEPIRKINCFCGELRTDLGANLSEAVAQDLDYIVDAARRMQSLLRSLLLLSKAEQEPIDFQTVNLERCVDQALELLADRIRECSARVERQPLPTLEGDPTLLTQLYQNLLCNALKFRGPQAPVISLTAECCGTAWLLSVRDNGIGVDAESAQKIFVPFQRLHPRGEYEGAGIGLTICKKVVDRHGGRIWVESATGKGAEFKIELPMRHAHPPQGEACPPRMSKRKGSPKSNGSKVAVVKSPTVGEGA